MLLGSYVVLGVSARWLWCPGSQSPLSTIVVSIVSVTSSAQARADWKELWVCSIWRHLACCSFLSPIATVSSRSTAHHDALSSHSNIVNLDTSIIAHLTKKFFVPKFMSTECLGKAYTLMGVGIYNQPRLESKVIAQQSLAWVDCQKCAVIKFF